jgi:hypothetical protein
MCSQFQDQGQFFSRLRDYGRGISFFLSLAVALATCMPSYTHTFRTPIVTTQSVVTWSTYRGLFYWGQARRDCAANREQSGLVEFIEPTSKRSPPNKLEKNTASLISVDALAQAWSLELDNQTQTATRLVKTQQAVGKCVLYKYDCQSRAPPIFH